MKRRRIIWRILKTTSADKIVYGFVGLFCLESVCIWLTEPTISTLWDSIWYCFTIVTTIGFGDQAATSFIARILTMVLSFYSVFVLAILTAVITEFFMEHMKNRAEASASEFLEKLEHLPELSKEELADLSQKAKMFGRGKRH